MKPRIGSLLLLVAVLWAVPAAGQTCPPPGVRIPAQVVTLSTRVADPTYTGEENRARITALSGLTRAESKDFTTGLTRTTTNLELVVQGWQVELGQGRRCIGLARAEAAWKITEIKVNIASEYPPGGCQYQVIRTHEDEHVAISHATFSRWTPRVERALRETADRIPPRVTARSADQETALFKETLLAAVKPVFEGFAAELKAANAAIDTPANYRRVNGQCPRW